MDDQPRTTVDEDDDPSDGTAESGPLGRLLGSEGADELLNRSTPPSAVSTTYAEGTREHDDDQE
jgi:hypothetical protein